MTDHDHRKVLRLIGEKFILMISPTTYLFNNKNGNISDNGSGEHLH